MRMLLPPVAERKKIDKLLSNFFTNKDAKGFVKALTRLCRWYRVRRPKVEWFEYLDYGKSYGLTYENGVIHLVVPHHWKGTLKEFKRVFYHEFYHYLHWVNDEDKAWDYAAAIMKRVC